MLFFCENISMASFRRTKRYLVEIFEVIYSLGLYHADRGIDINECCILIITVHCVIIRNYPVIRTVVTDLTYQSITENMEENTRSRGMSDAK